jgi:hypothetical protein
MIRLPQKGMARSVNKHNCDLAVACDWVESWVLLCEEDVSWSDIRDILLEQQIYSDQDFVDQFIESVWGELQQRIRWLGASSPLTVQSDRLVAVRESEEATAHAFMLALSLAPCFSGWSKQFGADYTQQGELFERLVEDAATVLFPGWKVHRTGWSSNNAVTLRDVTARLAKAIGAAVGDIDQWAGKNANESGLDIVWYRPFSDSRPSLPIYLAQCASGNDWPDKLDTPNLKIWMELIKFPQRPGKVFAIPFALESREHLRRSNQADAVLFDRYRLLYAGELDNEWQSAGFRQSAMDWLQPRIEWMRED